MLGAVRRASRRLAEDGPVFVGKVAFAVWAVIQYQYTGE